MRIAIKPVVLGLVLLALGFALGRQSLGPSSVDQNGNDALGALEMEAAVRSSLQTKGTLRRVAQLARLMENLDGNNVVGAAKVFDEKITSIDKLDIRLFLSAWTALDPEAAMDSVLAWTLPSMRRFGAGVVARDWAENGNALEAMARLRDVREWRTRDPAYGELVNGWVSSGDIEGVTEWVSSLPNSDGRDIISESMMKGILLQHGLDGIIRWADAVPVDAPDHFKKTAFRKALRQVSNRDPIRAAAWYEEQEEQEYATIMMAVVATEWVEADPEAAIAWVLERPPGFARVLALQRMIDRWVQIDREAATNWMQHADLDAELSPMLDPFIRGLAATQPEEAAEWLDRVRDPQQQETLTLAIAVTWRQRDADAADAWIETLELSEEARVKIAQMQPEPVSRQRLVIPEEKTP
jgi:hypothetical protein